VAHQHYKGTGKVHSFRGLLADGDQRKIRIQGATGQIAWRITKFEVMVALPGGANQDSVVKIWRELQDSVSFTVDFSSDELLAAATANQHDDDFYMSHVIFDNALFVRNIYVTHGDQGVGQSCNYYIELEEVKVSAAGMAQLSVAAARRTYVPGT